MYIYAFSKKMKDIAADLDEKSEQIILHLIKLQLYPDNTAVSHWRQEVYNFLHSVPSLKGSSKLPSSQFIMKYTWEYDKKWMPSYIKNVIGEYGTPKSYIDNNQLSSTCEDYFTWLADKLSTEKLVSKPEVYEKLKSIGC